MTLVSRQPGPGRITWDELAASGLPSCDAAVNLAGENILNPLRRWNETFQKEVLRSRLETTQLLAKAITKAPQPPKAWVLVTGVGMPPKSPAPHISHGKGVTQTSVGVHTPEHWSFPGKMTS